MKRWLVLAVAAIAIAGFTTVSFAAIQGSHHDMAAYRGIATADACYACHGIKAETATIASLGQVGNLCYLRCHIGSGSAGDISRLAGAVPEYGFFDNGTATVVAQSYTPAVYDKYGAGHLFLAGATNIPAPDTAAMVTATGWPYVGDANLQCTSCHDVHSNEYTPFVRAPLSDNANQANAFCQKCHGANADGAARWVTITANPNGSHPSEVDFTGAATRTVGGRAGRTILFKDVFTASDDDAVFRNVTAWGTNLNPRGAMYNPGGKLGAPQGAVFNASTGGVVGYADPLTIGNAWGNGSIGTYQTLNLHGLTSGQKVTITGLTPAGLNVTSGVVTVISPTAFTVANTTSGPTSTTGRISGIADSLPIAGGVGDLQKIYTTTNYWAVDDHNYTGTNVPVTTTTSSSGVVTSNAIAPTAFIANISQWCSTCHTRVLAGSGAWDVNSGDPMYTFKHRSQNGKEYSPNCIQCHVAHGTNAAMGGLSSSVGTEITGKSGDSFLLRVNSRGTCNMCHNL